MAVLRYAHRFEMLDMLAGPELRENPLFLLMQLRRNDFGDMLADDLLGPVAEDSRSASVPGRDAPIKRLADDCIVGRNDNGGKFCELQFRLEALGDEIG